MEQGELIFLQLSNKNDMCINTIMSAQFYTITKMSQQIDPNCFQVGDYVEVGEEFPMAKMIIKLTPEGVQLRDPLNQPFHADSKIYPHSELKLFRTRTKLKQLPTGTVMSLRKKIELSQVNNMVQSVEQMASNLENATPKEVIQALRGRFYYFGHTLLVNQIQGDIIIGAIHRYFKAVRKLFIRYVVLIDFEQFKPAEIYKNSMSALCSSYLEMFQLLEISSGYHHRLPDYRRNNEVLFQNQAHEKDIQEWLQCQLLPFFVQAKHQLFPIGFQINLLVLVVCIVRKTKLQISQPLAEFTSLLYQQILGRLTKVLITQRQLQIFYENMPLLFKIMHIGTSQQNPTLDHSKTQKIQIGVQGLKNQQPSMKVQQEQQKSNVKTQETYTFSSFNKEGLNQSQYIKIKEIEFRSHVAYAYLVRGEKEKVAEALSFCMDEVIKTTQQFKDVKIREDKLHFKQHWPQLTHCFLNFIQEKKILEQILGNSIYNQNIVLIRILVDKFYVYLPKYTILCCFNNGKHHLVKNILGSKVIKEDICQWLFQYIINQKIQDRHLKAMCQFLKFLEIWMKNRQVFPNYNQNRKLMIQKLLELGSRLENIEPNIFQSVLNFNDNLKISVFQSYCKNSIFTELHLLQSNFKEYLLVKYCQAHQITLNDYQRMLQPMLATKKEIKAYQRRKTAIITVLHFLYSLPAKQRYFNYLKLFIDYYSHPQHDKSLIQNKWRSYSIQPKLQPGDAPMTTFVDLQFCESVLHKLLPLSSQIDISLFNQLLIKYNAIKGHITLLYQKLQIRQVTKLPFFFKEMLEAYYNLDKNELKIHQQYISKYFTKANENVFNEMLKLFLEVILEHDSSVKEANQAFKNYKTRSPIFWPLTQKNNFSSTNTGIFDYKIRFNNHSIQQRFHQYGSKYADNELRMILIDQQKRSNITLDIKACDVINSIKQRLASKLNRQPCEIFFINIKGDFLTPQQEANSFGMEVSQFIAGEDLQKLRTTSKGSVNIDVWFILQLQRSPIYKCILEHAEEIFQQMPKSLSIFQGIDLKLQNWVNFDRTNSIASSFEKAVSSEEIPGIFLRNQYLQTCLLDYFLWKKEQEDLKLYDFRSLYSLAKRIQHIRDIFTNLKISYLIFASGNFRAQDRERLLNLLLFLNPYELNNTKFDEQGSYFKLNQIVYIILQSKSEGALQFCFTTKCLAKLTQAQITHKNFKYYWIKEYRRASFQQKKAIFQNIQERIINFPNNMAQLGVIIQDEHSCQCQVQEMYQEAIQRMVKQIIAVNKLKTITRPLKITEILLQNCNDFLKSQFTHPIIHSKQFLLFLIQNSYEYILHIPLVYFELLVFVVNSQESRNQFIDFFGAEINVKEWAQQQSLDVPRKPKEYQNQGLVGLANVKNVCFANSLLQQLFHIPAFCQQLLATEWKREQSPEEDLILQLKKIFINLKQSRQPHYNNDFFERAFKFYGSPIEPYTQMDVDQFRNTLFSNLEQLLPKNIFWNKLFVGKQVSKITCLQCNNVSNTEQTFDSIHLPIQDFYTLQKSLHQYTKSLILQNENAYSCEKCNKKVKAQKEIVIKDLPPHLIFVLKRFQYLPEKGSRRKLLNYFQFPLDKLQWLPEKKYKLKGIICHIGIPENGHYLSYIKLENQWYQFNDARVHQVTQEEVKNSTFGIQKANEKSLSNERTAYLLFYEAIDNTQAGTKMEIQFKIVGVNQEIQRARKEKTLGFKERTYFSYYYLQFVITLCQKYPEQKAMRLLLCTLIKISFKLRINQPGQSERYNFNIIQCFKIISRNYNHFPFIWQQSIIQQVMEFLKIFLPSQYKTILAFLLIQNCHGHSKLAERVLDHCLTSIYTPKLDNSPYYNILYGMVKKFEWAEQYVLQKRCVGRILDVIYQGIFLSDIRNQLKQTTDLPFESGQRVEPTWIKQGLRHYRWALLSFLVQRNYSLLHEKQMRYIRMQITQAFQRLFDECKSKAEMRYLNQYFCFLSHHLQMEYTTRLLNFIRDSLIRDKPDSLRKYLKTIKDLVAIKDDFQQNRNQNAITIFLKILQNLSNTNGESMEYIWLWMLKIANKNEVFRTKLSSSRVLFDFLIHKSFNNSLISRFEKLNGFPRTRYLLHKIPIAQNQQQAIQFHSNKVQKTKSLLLNHVYQKDLTEEDSDADIADETHFPHKIYIFVDSSQNFDPIHISFVLGDVIVTKTANAKDRFPASRTLFKGDQRLYLKSPLITIDEDESTPVRRPKEEQMSEKNSISSSH